MLSYLNPVMRSFEEGKSTRKPENDYTALTILDEAKIDIASNIKLCRIMLHSGDSMLEFARTLAELNQLEILQMGKFAIIKSEAPLELIKNVLIAIKNNPNNSKEVAFNFFNNAAKSEPLIIKDDLSLINHKKSLPRTYSEPRQAYSSAFNLFQPREEEQEHKRVPLSPYLS